MPKAASARASNLLPWMVEHRRHLHANPEVGLSLPDTHAYVKSVLTQIGLTVEATAGTGLTARIAGTSGPGQVRVLRADMDALPLTENTDLEYSSIRQGAMHACGHDIHTATLLGVAKVLAERPARHDVILAFQPGEESDRGALQILSHRNLQLHSCTAAFALHVHALQPAHSINYRHGTFMANGDWFKVTFSGPGGHASSPNLTGNPADASAEFIQRMHALTRRLSHRESVIATVTEVLTGNSVNVIPVEGTLRGTIRTLSTAQRDRLIAELATLVEQAAAEARVQGTISVREGYPAVISDRAYLDRLLKVLHSSPLSHLVTEMDQPSMVIEDFSYFLQRWPGAMLYLGANVAGATAFNHSARVVFDEEVMTTGLDVYLMAADLDVPFRRSRGVSAGSSSALPTGGSSASLSTTTP